MINHACNIILLSAMVQLFLATSILLIVGGVVGIILGTMGYDMNQGYSFGYPNVAPIIIGIILLIAGVSVYFGYRKNNLPTT
jgi:hypothetical protein